jgi:hypothetical protein
MVVIKIPQLLLLITLPCVWLVLSISILANKPLEILVAPLGLFQLHLRTQTDAFQNTQ